MLIPKPEPANERSVALAVDGAVYQPYVPRPDPAVSAHELLALLRGRLGIIIGGTVLGLCLGAGVAALLPKNYVAQGLIVVDTQEIVIPDLQPMRSQGTIEPWGARSAARVLVSRDIVDDAARRLNLIQDPAYNPYLRSGLVDRVLSLTWIPAWVPAQLTSWLPRGSSSPATSSGIPSEAEQWAEVVDNVQKRLDAASEERSYAIGMELSGPNPRISAELLNAIMTAYLDHELEAKRRTMTEAAVQLKEQTAQLARDLETAWAGIRELESKSDLVTTEQGTVVSQRLVGLTEQDRAIDDEIGELRADLSQAETAWSEGRTNLLSGDLVTPRLETLMSAEAALRQRAADGAASLGPRHPEMRAIDAELARVQADMSSEMRGIRDGIQRRIAEVESRRSELRAGIEQAGQVAALSASSRAELERLRFDAQSRQKLHDTYQERYSQAIVGLSFIQPGLRVASWASPPTRPTGPGPKLLSGLGGVAGTLLSIAFVLGHRWWSGRLENMRELTAATGVPTLGGIPKIGSMLTPSNAWRSRITRSNSTTSETVRGILFRLQKTDPVPKVIMITSAEPGEGKTTLALSLVKVAARDGQRALCIDLDLRRPTLTENSRVRGRWALNDYLDGAIDWPDAVSTDFQTGASIIRTRVDSGDPRRYLRDPRLVRLFDQARQQYDVVVVDTPPVLRVIDPLQVANLVDGVIVVVSKSNSSRDAVRETVDRLTQANARVVGAVMTGITGRLPTEYVFAGYDQR